MIEIGHFCPFVGSFGLWVLGFGCLVLPPAEMKCRRGIGYWVFEYFKTKTSSNTSKRQQK